MQPNLPIATLMCAAFAIGISMLLTPIYYREEQGVAKAQPDSRGSTDAANSDQAKYRLSLQVEFPKGFTVDNVARGPFDASDGDVLVGAASHENGCQIKISFNSAMPLTDSQLEEFGARLLEVFPLQGIRIDAHKVLERNGTNVFFATFMAGDRVIVLLFRSFWDSVLSSDFSCPLSLEPSIARDLLDEVLDKFSHAELEKVVVETPAEIAP